MELTNQKQESNKIKDETDIYNYHNKFINQRSSIFTYKYLFASQTRINTCLQAKAI